ncbi:MAG: imidazolonepropionase [Deltaproteobacteria bacterium]|nr:imidazolonepropionase [Deltaproteobacteria bacterium]
MVHVLLNSSFLYQGLEISAKDGRKLIASDLTTIPNGALVYSTKSRFGKSVPDKILWAGPTKELPKKYKKYSSRNLKNQFAIMPGLIDCHTHLIFAGDRSDEFAERCAGATYEEITKKGGGILKTVQATRQASLKELENLAIRRIRDSMHYGVRTIEIKSGYGLKHDTEIKILTLIQKLQKKFPELTIISTFLGAHAFPKEKTREDYINEICNIMLPEIAEKKLAQACDIFVDEGYYTIQEASHILTKARSFGFKIKLHGDELQNTEATALAVQMNALSADHLLKISEAGINKIANSDTVAVLLPGTAFYLKSLQAPARKLLSKGACVALASDFNPGTCMCLNLPAILTIAALYLEMNRAELFASVTYNAAKALGLEKHKGVLTAGFDADFFILPFQRFEELYYRFAWRV